MISVVVPVYNVERYISITIDSIINQTFQNFELILVDDGSTDTSGEICEKWKLRDKRIKVIHKSNGGLSSARNVGLENAIGKYIAFIDSDDIIAPAMFEEMVTLLDANPQVGIVSCGIATFVDGSSKFYSFLGQISTNKYSFKEYFKLILQHKLDNSVCTKIYRKEIVNKLRFIEGRINEDFIFNAHIFIENPINEIYYISEPFYNYRLRKGSITMQANPKGFDFVRNALEIKEVVAQRFGNELDKELNAYLCYEIVNYISTMEKYSAADIYKSEIEFCKKMYMQNFLRNYMNTAWPISAKIKALIVLSCPWLYRLILALK